MRVGASQIRSTEDPWENLASVCAFVEEATAASCDLICFPENILFRGRKAALKSDFFLSLDANGRIQENSDFAQALAECAQGWKIAVSLGSVPQQSGDASRPFNSHWIIQGSKVHPYHKIHLFNYSGEFGLYRESDEMSPGETTSVVDVAGKKVGLSICYDLRFPELYRELSLQKGAEVLLVPAAFTLETGRAHWHTLLRARAIENLSFVLAAAQWGSHINKNEKELFCYGHSLIISPWGEILAEAPEVGDSLLVVDLNFDQMREKRERLPARDAAVVFNTRNRSET